MKICQLVFSSVVDDPRVRRHCDALTDAGHEVTAVGFGGGASDLPGWEVIALSRPPDGLVRALKAARVALSPVRSQGPSRTYWQLGTNREMFGAARGVDAEVWVANDWSTLPIAARLAEEKGGVYVYDSHEYAPEVGADSLEWRVRMGPYIRHIERSCIAGAAAVITVSDNIADLLQGRYDLAVRPSVVRNLPPYQVMPFRPAGEEVRVLFHGLLGRNRNLESIIESVRYWPAGYALTIRGAGPTDYERHLRNLAGHSTVRNRICFVPAVPMTDLVRRANEADIGIHAIQGRSAQTRYSLPNKFFEYVMAGLALCVTDLPEMGALVRRYGLGVTVPGTDGQAIGTAVRSLARSAIDKYKESSLEAARELAWDRERHHLFAVLDSIRWM